MFDSNDAALQTLDDFWVIVDDASGRANGNKARFLDTISVSLRNLSAHEIVEFKRRMQEATGLDLNTPPPGPLSEQLSTYQA